MGTPASASDEWLELYNSTSAEVDLKNYTISDAKGVLLELSGKIKPKAFYLIERGSETVLTLPASETPKKWAGVLSNGGAKLALSDSTGRIIDLLDFSNGWPKGDAKTRASMERDLKSLEWVTASSSSKVLDRSGVAILGSPLTATVLSEIVESSTKPVPVTTLEMPPAIQMVLMGFKEGVAELVLTFTPQTGTSFTLRPEQGFLWETKNQKWLYATDPWNTFPDLQAKMLLRVKTLDNQGVRFKVRNNRTTTVYFTDTLQLPKSERVGTVATPATDTVVNTVRPVQIAKYNLVPKTEEASVSALPSSIKPNTWLVLVVFGGLALFVIFLVVMLKFKGAIKKDT